MTTATNLLEERALDVGDVRLRYAVGGGGDPVVLVHGLGGAASNWIELLPELLEHYRVLVLDLPGHGGSGALPHGAGMSDFADAVASVIEHEEASPALVFGHSFGGQAALRLAQRRPALVRGLLLAAPSGIRTGARVVQALVLVSSAVRPARLVAPFRHRFSERLWYRRALFRPWFVSDPLAFSSRATLGFLDGAPAHTDMGTAGRAMLADDPRLDLEHVSCPVVVLWGARDAQLPLDDAFEYARRLHAKLRVVADCGHLVIGERPHACLDALEELRRAA
ncbi:MAG TPA: alpha/beta fold hydrolase [Gaiellaceae bacterium]|nr:alpha/beta fold hydrolase [Gaiellaceae bacterium]